MVFSGASLDAYQASGASPLAMLEKKQRTFLGISWGEIKLLAIAGVGFFSEFNISLQPGPESFG